MLNKKQISVLLILAMVLAGTIFAFWLKYGEWPWQREVSVPSSTVSGQPSESFAKEPRDYVMEDVAERINELSPVEPVLGGKWYVLRFWFIDGSYATFYVECEEGHIMRKFLMTADVSQAPEKFSYQVDAVFDAGESDWVLVSGKDQKSNLPLILYEYDEAAGRWTQRN
ncbi:MAG: hypothetical protein PHW33_00245 [Candidatus Portnoybacteria bacterium]|jgi:hypothetical protein|nr:hypothetical protein [Candidatus Portnoybacteria bacterium]